MPFPTTPILDNFNRADSSSIGGDWSQFMRSGSYDMGISSNQEYNPDAEYNGLYHDAAQFGPDCETYVTVAVLPPYENYFALYIRLKDVTVDVWNYDGYQAGLWRYDNAGNDRLNLTIRRVDDNVLTQLGAGVDIGDHGNGDRLGIRAVGSSLELWYDDGAGWELRATRTDGTYGAAGYVGFFHPSEGTMRLDDFGGGNYESFVRQHGRLLTINEGMKLNLR